MPVVLAAGVVLALIGTAALWVSQRDPDEPPSATTSGVATAPAQPSAEADEARRVAEGVERGLEKARGLMAAGQFDAAATAAGEVLALAPANVDAKTIMDEAATRSRGRGADEARERMANARGAAVAASAQTLAAAQFGAAQKGGREALALHKRGLPAEAMTRFWEASGLYRAAEIAANTEAVARRERARTAQAERRRAEPERRDTPSKPAPSPAPPQASMPPTVPATTGLPQSPAAVPVPPPTVPSPPPVQTPAASKPEAQPAPQAPPKEAEPPSPAAGITDLLNQYKAALESRSLEGLKRIWPGLSSGQESAIRYEFQNARRIDVDILSPQINPRGNTATVTFVRRYQLDTVDGQQLRTETRTTMTVHRNGANWVIDQIRFEPGR